MMTVSQYILAIIISVMLVYFAAVEVNIQTQLSVEEAIGSTSVCVVLGNAMVERVLEFLISPIADGSAIGKQTE